MLINAQMASWILFSNSLTALIGAAILWILNTRPCAVPVRYLPARRSHRPCLRGSSCHVHPPACTSTHLSHPEQCSSGQHSPTEWFPFFSYLLLSSCPKLFPNAVGCAHVRWHRKSISTLACLITEFRIINDQHNKPRGRTRQQRATALYE